MRGFLVLVVDDESAIREILTEVLTEEGYRVHCVSDGQEALDRAADEPPDVVVSDVRMPRVDGLELIRQLRARGQEMPVVLISAHYAGVDVPGVRFLRKPFDLDHLVREIERTLADS